jgi:hypothetical protein
MGLLEFEMMKGLEEKKKEKKGALNTRILQKNFITKNQVFGLNLMQILRLRSNLVKKSSNNPATPRKISGPNSASKFSFKPVSTDSPEAFAGEEKSSF